MTGREARGLLDEVYHRLQGLGPSGGHADTKIDRLDVLNVVREMRREYEDDFRVPTRGEEES